MVKLESPLTDLWFTQKIKGKVIKFIEKNFYMEIDLT